MALPHAAETLNWGHHLVYWAGHRDIGGKMFAMSDLDGTGFRVLWFHCGVERFRELLEIEGISPCPHLARAHWVTLERWDVLRPREIENELRRAHALIFERHPKRTKELLATPERERRKVLAARERGVAVKKRPNGAGRTETARKPAGKRAVVKVAKKRTAGGK